MAAKKTPGGRGGRRKGAGRKAVLKSAVRMTAHIEKSVLAGLKSEAKAQEISVGALVRRVLAAHLKRRKK